MTGCGGLSVGLSAGKPRLLGEIYRPQANRAFVLNCRENDLSLCCLPGIATRGFVANRVVEKQETIPIQREGCDAFPPGGEVNDPEHALVELNLPDAPFGRVVRAAPAGHLGVVLRVHFGVSAVQRSSFRRWKPPLIRERLSLKQGSPFFSRSFFGAYR